MSNKNTGKTIAKDGDMKKVTGSCMPHDGKVSQESPEIMRSKKNLASDEMISNVAAGGRQPGKIQEETLPGRDFTNTRAD